MNKIWILLLATLAISNAFADPATDVGTIESVDPAGTTVTVKNPQGVSAEKAPGAPIGPNDHILSKKGQTVVLHLKDDSNVTVAPGADVAVQDYIPSKPDSVPHVQLNQGSAHFDVPKTDTTHTKFFIRTNSATMGVRGTDFVVDQQSDGYSVVHTLSGNVAVAKNEADLEDHTKSVEVPAGRTSYMNQTMAHPAAPRVFNRKSYLTQLSKTYPAMSHQIHQSEQRRRQAEAANPRLANHKRAQEKKQQQDSVTRKPRRRNAK